MKDVDVAEANAAKEGVNWLLAPQVVRNESGNEAPDEDDQWNVETSLKTNYRVSPQIGEVNLLT